MDTTTDEYIRRYEYLVSRPPVDELTGGTVLVKREVMAAIITYIRELELKVAP